MQSHLGQMYESVVRTPNIMSASSMISYSLVSALELDVVSAKSTVLPSGKVTSFFAPPL